jgi:hypothetical protein
VNSISLGEYEKVSLLGLALDEPGNVWGIKTPPEDWHHKGVDETNGRFFKGVNLG